MKCPNCGSDVPKDSKLCPNCGAAFYPRSVPLTRREKLRNLAFGRPFNRRVALAFAIVGGVAGGVMGTCGLMFAFQPNLAAEPLNGFGIFFAFLGFAIVLYAYWEWRRARKMDDDR